MRVFIASNNEGIATKLREVLGNYGHECQVFALNPLDVAANRLAQTHADMLVVVLSPNPEPALALLREQRNPSIQRVLAVGPVSEPKLRLGALREGADQYLDEAELKPELEAILRRVSIQAAAPAQGENGKVISVLAPSGGSGSSTLAVNLATALAREHKNCILFDLNLGAGDLASLLDLKPTHTLADLCRNATRMDRAIFERSLVRHPCGVALLAPARSFADIGQVTTQGVRDALTLARGLFPYVIVDLDDSFHSEQTQTLRQSDIILLVLRLDFTSLRNTRRTLDHLDQMHISRGRVQLVVNRYGQPQELPAAKAEEALGMKIAHYVPDDPKTINRANNNGIPAVLEAPTAKVSKSVIQLAVSVNGQAKGS
jgi:pilus assembly protein CpaE